MQTIYPSGFAIDIRRSAASLAIFSKAPAGRAISVAWRPWFSSSSRSSGPDVACFGQKDFQQQLLIRRMVQDLHLTVEIDTCPTIREADGLAMSSRNRYLNPAERKAAGVLFRALENASAAAVPASTRPAGFDRFFVKR